MKPAQLLPALLLPLLAWRIYVRMRRNIGRQPLQPRRMIARIIVLSVATILIGLGAVTHPPVRNAFAAGLLLGLPLAWLGVRLTWFETTPEGKFYTPNTIIGIGLTVLFVGRIIYRLMVLSVAAADRDPNLPQFFQSSLTLLVFGVTAGYYIAYNAGVLNRAREKKQHTS